jgi:hypothetical protein
MSIDDFYSKFVSATESSTLVESLRRLSLLDDLKAMCEEELFGEWGYWTPESGGGEA